MHDPAPVSRTRVGITGARGVLGRRIVEQFTAQGLSPVAFHGDVRDRAVVDEFVKGIDVVIHSAATVPVTVVASDPGSAVSVNVGGTANVAMCASRYGRPLVYISTSHVYATSEGFLQESSPVRPSSLYGLTKYQGESWCQELHPRPLILRVFSFFDPEQRPPYLVPSLKQRIQMAPRGATLVIRGSQDERDLASAIWMAKVIADLVQRGMSGIVNCGTGQGVRVIEVADRLAVMAGRVDLNITSEVPPAPHSRIVADTSLLKGWLPELAAFDLRQALKDMFDHH